MPFGVTLRKTGSVKSVKVEPPAATPVDVADPPPRPPPPAIQKPSPGNTRAALEAAARGGSSRALAKLAALDATVAAPTAPAEKPRRPSLTRANADLAIKPAWEAFLSASEINAAVEAYQVLRKACEVPGEAFGRVAFDGVLQATLVAEVPHRIKSLVQTLAENWKTRPVSHSGARVVISGAGPVGLRAAVEASLMGMRVHVLEKRDVFSRVNVLMLWQQTADDLVAYGARTFYVRAHTSLEPGLNRPTSSCTSARARHCYSHAPSPTDHLISHPAFAAQI